jgi:hypothetical protein
MLFGLGSGRAAEACRGRSGTANTSRGSHKLEQIECDIFIAPGSKPCAVESIHSEKSPKRMLPESGRLHCAGKRAASGEKVRFFGLKSLIFERKTAFLAQKRAKIESLVLPVR